MKRLRIGQMERVITELNDVIVNRGVVTKIDLTEDEVIESVQLLLDINTNIDPRGFNVGNLQIVQPGEPVDTHDNTTIASTIDTTTAGMNNSNVHPNDTAGNRENSIDAVNETTSTHLSGMDNSSVQPDDSADIRIASIDAATSEKIFGMSNISAAITHEDCAACTSEQHELSEDEHVAILDSMNFPASESTDKPDSRSTLIYTSDDDASSTADVFSTPTALTHTCDEDLTSDQEDTIIQNTPPFSRSDGDPTVSKNSTICTTASLPDSNEKPTAFAHESHVYRVGTITPKLASIQKEGERADLTVDVSVKAETSADEVIFRVGAVSPRVVLTKMSRGQKRKQVS